MASVTPYVLAGGERRWKVKYRDASHRQHMKRGFKTKKAAQDYANRIEVSISDHAYVDPANGKATIDMLGRKWLEGKRGIVKPKYYTDLESAWRNHVQPQWGSRTVAGIRHSEIQAWVSRMSADHTDADGNTTPGKSATVVLRAYGILKGIMDDALADRRITRNPCENTTLPRKTRKERVYLPPRQVLDLAAASGRYSALILTLGFCGLRWGEAAALRVGNVDFERKRILVRSSWVRAGSRHYEGKPKSWETRDVPMPRIVAQALREQCRGRASDDLVFTRPNGERIVEQSADVIARKDDAYRWYGRALQQSGCPRLTIHDLRHTAASIAISSGANVKALQRMLGHKSAAMTLDTYADLFDTDLDDIAVNMDARIETAMNEQA